MDAVNETVSLANDDLIMRELCTILARIKSSREINRANEVKIKISIKHSNMLMMDLMKEIKELERTGIKRVEVKEDVRINKEAPQAAV